MINTQDKKNAVWNSVSFIIVSIAGFINFTLTIKTYSTEIFGLYILLSSIFGLGYNIDFGFGAATIRQISIAKNENDFETQKKFFFTFLLAYILISIVITLIMSFYFFIFVQDSTIVLSVKNVNVITIYVFISCSYLIRYLNNYFKNIFEGFSEFVVLSKIIIILTLVNTLLILSLFIFKLDIIYLAFFTFLFQLVSLFVYFFTIKYSFKELSFSFKYYDFALIKKYSLYGINIQVSTFINSIIDPLIKFLLGSSLSLSFVTYYETSKKIIDLSNGLIFSAQKGIFNKLSEQHSAGTMKEFVNNNLPYYSKMSNYYSILVYGLLNPIICIGMMLWFKSYESMVILVVFFLPYTLINFGGVLYLVLMVDGKGIKLIFTQLLNLFTASLFLYLSLYLFKSYIGLSAFYFSIVVSILVIFIILNKSISLNKVSYLQKSNFIDLAKLNILLLSQIILLFFVSEYYLYILGLYFLLYNLLFIKYLKYFINEIFKRINGLKKSNQRINA